jgi:hypothetical protein
MVAGQTQVKIGWGRSWLQPQQQALHMFAAPDLPKLAAE